PEPAATTEAVETEQAEADPADIQEGQELDSPLPEPEQEEMAGGPMPGKKPEMKNSDKGEKKGQCKKRHGKKGHDKKHAKRGKGKYCKGLKAKMASGKYPEAQAEMAKLYETKCSSKPEMGDKRPDEKSDGRKWEKKGKKRGEKMGERKSSESVTTVVSVKKVIEKKKIVRMHPESKDKKGMDRKGEKGGEHKGEKRRDKKMKDGMGPKTDDKRPDQKMDGDQKKKMEEKRAAARKLRAYCMEIRKMASQLPQGSAELEALKMKFEEKCTPAVSDS
ncbi:MAG: hypothetical protein F6K07_33230, partial [Okeania sp. SIO1H5]|uniref:hypothetical protein n=1 Tax=Okeania sp. SIO1H5 TaxID=2607777 RepID=UPI0013BBFE0F